MTIKYQPSNQQLNNRNGFFQYFSNAKLSRLLIFSGLLLLWSCGAEPNTDESAADDLQLEQSEQGYAQLGINPPFSFSDESDGEIFVIENPASGTVLTTKSGTVLSIPANAIVDNNGTTVTAPVKIRYREFREAAEIISSGIPMTVKQENGTEEWMQTAGMFEIRGYQNGQAVALAEGKSIKVDFVSKVGGDYDAWVFDEEAGNWVNLGPGAAPEEMTLNGEERAALEKEIEDLREETAQAPENPEYEKQNELKVEDPIDLSQFPELQNVKPLIFAYAGTDAQKAPKNNTWIRDKDWSRYELASTKKKGVYELILLAEDTTFNILVKKALQGQNLEAARARYQALLADFNAKLVSLSKKEEFLSQQRSFRRTIEAEGFNIYNYDILWKSKNSIPLMADFKFDELPGTLKEAVTVYFITKNNQVVVGLPKPSWKAFRFDPGMDNKLIAVLPDNQVALFTQSDFKAKDTALKAARGKEYAFDMTVKKEPIQKLNDLKEIIKMASL